MNDIQKTVLVIDQSGRGHAICDLFIRTDNDVIVYYAPGCSAINNSRIISVPEISLTHIDTALDFCQKHHIDFVFVSHIQSLSVGYVDRLKSAGIAVIGPSQLSARLENSKLQGKRFCEKYQISIPQYKAFNSVLAAKRHIHEINYDVVVKIDSLCDMSDGAYVCNNKQDALSAIDEINSLVSNFAVVIEEKLFGEEISIFAFVDGENYCLFPTALDYKKVYENNKGKNCDGMGSITPHTSYNNKTITLINKKIISRLLHGIKREKLDYTGFIYAGGIITESGEIKIIEINTRFGDSEAEAILPGISSNFYDLCCQALNSNLTQTIKIDNLARCSVALVQGSIASNKNHKFPGWPLGPYEKGQRITGTDHINKNKADIFFAGLKLNENAEMITTSGRVLHVVGKGRDIKEAKNNAYSELHKISFLGMKFRTDIGEF